MRTKAGKYKTPYTKGIILSHLKAVSKAIGKSPTFRDLKIIPGPSPRTVVRHFKTWSNAIRSTELQYEGAKQWRVPRSAPRPAPHQNLMICKNCRGCIEKFERILRNYNSRPASPRVGARRKKRGSIEQNCRLETQKFFISIPY
jgi:hypothetical protein